MLYILLSLVIGFIIASLLLFSSRYQKAGITKGWELFLSSVIILFFWLPLFVSAFVWQIIEKIRK